MTFICYIYLDGPRVNCEFLEQISWIRKTNLNFVICHLMWSLLENVMTLRPQIINLFHQMVTVSAVATKIWKKRNLKYFFHYLSPNFLFEPHSQSIWSCFYQDTTNIELPCRVPYTSNTRRINFTVIFTCCLFIVSPYF